jgi:hypothetical protein
MIQTETEVGTDRLYPKGLDLKYESEYESHEAQGRRGHEAAALISSHSVDLSRSSRNEPLDLIRR